VQKQLTCFGGTSRLAWGCTKSKKATRPPTPGAAGDGRPDKKIKELADNLSAIPGVDVKALVFEHP